MRQSVVQLEQFYAGRLGRLTEIMATRRLQNLWPDLTGRHVLGFGYAGGFIRPHLETAKSAVLAMPATQGAVVARTERGIMSVLVQDDCLPFADASFDNVIVAHGLEEAVDVDHLLKELWRVTMPEGRIVIIATHRKGLWAQFDHTPLGAGRPFSRTQLRHALNRAGFLPSLSAGVLYAPPLRFFARPRLSIATEKLGETLWPGFSGLIMLEGIKRLYAEQNRGFSERVKRRSPAGVVIPGMSSKPLKDSSSD